MNKLVYINLVVKLLLPCAAISAQDKTEITECKLPEIRDELAKRVEADQVARKSLGKLDRNDKDYKKKELELENRTVKIDKKNAAWLKKQVEKHGWLGKTLVGKEGAHNAWLLAQHADLDPKFQKHCLELMTKMPDGEVAQSDIAYLTDRVLVAENKPQRYGTQVHYPNGKVEVREVEDPENLNKRRLSVGLGSVEEYLKIFEKVDRS